MIEFTCLFIFRSVSGLQNGLGYARKEVLRSVTSLALGLALIGFILYFTKQPPTILKPVAILLALISVLGVMGVEINFNKGGRFLKRDTHFWELLATGGITLACFFAGFNLVNISASVYPALILHKGFINLGSKQKWFYEGTDDKTGDTYGIPSLGIKIPRMGTMFRISVAVLSIMAMIINSSLKWSLTIHDIIAIWP